MPGQIFNIQDDGTLVSMDEQPFENEDLFQGLLAKYPNLLAGDQMDTSSPRRWLLVKREMGIPGEEAGGERWSLDHLFLDQEGIPTLVEVKRSSDTRLRREVVGQMLDYAANAVVYWPVEQIRAEFEASGEDAAERLGDLLGEDGDPERFWQQVKTNLQAKKIRLLFVADVIPPELRRIVEFLNEVTDPTQVLAVEIKHYIGQGLKTLVPRVIGTGRKPPLPPSSKEWDEVTFLAELESRQGSEQTEVAKQILEWCAEKQVRLWWGKGVKRGSFFPLVDHNGEGHFTISAWTIGTIQVQFRDMATQVPFDSENNRQELLRRLNEIPNVTISNSELAKKPGFAIQALCNRDAMQKFLGVMDWIVGEIKGT